MYYHAAVLLLFRPFLRAKFTESAITPADICRQAATALSDLFARHLALYGATGVYTFHLQGLLAACTIHLVNLPAISSAAALTAAARSLAALVHRHAWASAALRLIRALVRRWGIVVPGELEAALYSGAGGEEESPAAAGGGRGEAPSRRCWSRGGGRLRSDRRRRRRRLQAAEAVGAVARPVGPAAGAPPPPERPGRGRRAPPPPPRCPSASASRAAPARTPRPSRATTATPASGRCPGSQTSTSSSPHFRTSSRRRCWGRSTRARRRTRTSSGAEEEVRRVTRDFDGLRFEGDGWFDPFMGI